VRILAVAAEVSLSDQDPDEDPPLELAERGTWHRLIIPATSDGCFTVM
jgi:hypothetical protein